MSLIAFVAMGTNRVIGQDGKLPWHIPDDLKRFKQLTLGHDIIMGRKTFDSLGRVLPGRRHIVLTRDQNWTHEGVVVARSPADVLALQEGKADDAFVIGGGEIYALLWPYIDKILLTVVEAEPKGDAFFPDVFADKDFAITSKSELMLAGDLAYRYIDLQRVHT